MDVLVLPLVPHRPTKKNLHKLTFFGEPVGQQSKHQSAEDGGEESAPVVADGKVDGRDFDAKQHPWIRS